MKRLLILFTFISISYGSFASHMLGGTITWKCLPNGQFVFYMEVYRDCTGIQWTYRNETVDIVGSPLPKDGTGAILNSIAVLPDSNRWVNENFGDLTDRCSQSSGIQYSCANWDQGTVQAFYYKSNPITLYGKVPSSGWSIFWQAPCCRPNDIDNVNTNGSLLLRATMYSDNTNQNASSCFDSSPEFATRPSILAKRGYTVKYDYSALDQDRDSLVYSWNRPINAPISNPLFLNYKPGYSPTTPFPDTSLNILNHSGNLDSFTGEMEFAVYSGIGTKRYLTVVQVEAYRNGRLISKNVREIPVAIVDVPLLPNGQINNPPIVNVLGGADLDTAVTIGSYLTIPIAIDELDSNTNSLQFVEVIPFGDLLSNNLTDSTDCDSPTNIPCATLRSQQITVDSSFINPKLILGDTGRINATFSWQVGCNHLSADGSSREHVFKLDAADDNCPSPEKAVGTVRVNVKPLVVNQNPYITCFSRNGNIYSIPWDITGSITNFKQWVFVAKPIGSNNFIRIDSTSIESVRSFGITASKFAGYSEFKIFMEYTMCGNLTFAKSSDLLKPDLSLNVEATPIGLQLMWSNFAGSGGPSQYKYIHANIDGAGFQIVDSVSSNRTSYIFVDSLCYSNISFYTSGQDCLINSDTTLYSDTNNGISLLSTSTSSCLQLSWSNSLSAPKMTYIYMKVNAGNFELIDSVRYSNSYCLIDTFCYNALTIQVRRCGVVSNQRYSTPGSRSSNLNLTTNIACVQLDWNFSGYSDRLNPLLEYNILKSYNDTNYFKIGETKENQWCLVEEDCDISAYYKVQTIRCNDKTRAIYNTGVNLPIDTSISINNSTLIANQTNAAYFWYDCLTKIIIPDSTGQTFSPKDTGVYAVVIRRFQCQDTSACIPFFPVGLSENTFQSQLNYYPNPTNGVVQIDFKKVQQNVVVEVYSIQGKLVRTEKFRSGNSFELNLNQPSGIYFIQLTNEKGERANLKVMKQ